MNKGNIIIVISTIMIIISLSGCNSVKEDNADIEPLVTNVSDDSSINANEVITNNAEDEVKRNDEKSEEDEETIPQSGITQKRGVTVPIEFSDMLFVDAKTFEIFVQRELEEQVITKLPPKMIDYYQNEKELPNNQFLFYDNVYKYQVDQCVMFISDSRIDIYDINEDKWDNLMEGTHVNKVHYDKEVETVSYYEDMFYDIKFVFDSSAKRFKPFTEIKESYFSIGKWEDKVYIGYEYVSDELKDHEQYVFNNYPYIIVEISAKEYHIVDSFQVNDEVYFIEYETRYLYKVNDEGEVSPVIEKPIRMYDFFRDKMVFSHYGYEMGLLYFDFIEKTPIVLNDEEAFVDVKLSKNHIAASTIDEEVFIYNIDNFLDYRTYEIPIDSTIQYHHMPELEVDNEHLYLNSDEMVHVVNLKTMEIIDHFRARFLSVAENQRVFYSILGNLIEYNPINQSHELIDMAGYALGINPFNDELLVYEGIDGPGNYTLHNMNTRYLEKNYPDSLDADYVLFYRSTEYGSELMIYDMTKRRLEIVIEADGSVEYQVVDNKLLYREKHYDSGKIQYSEWYEYVLEDGSIVYDINEVVERTRREIQYYINQGYINEVEVCEEDNGRFIIYAFPFYNDGKWDEKGLAVFVFGAHGKGYSMMCDEFRVDSTIKLNTIVPNEMHDRFYVVYEMDGKKMVTLFKVGKKGFDIALVMTKEITGECYWSEDGETIEFDEY